MALIVANFPGIEGESTLAGYENLSEAVAIRDSAEIPVPTSSGRVRGSRSVGLAVISDVELTRVKDVSSPKLAEACSSGKNLGSVVVTLFRTIETGLVPYLIYSLEQTFVSRIENETLDEKGLALYPHISESAEVTPSPRHGLVSAVFPSLRELRGGRTVVRPASWIPSGTFTNTEIERVYLNASKVTWTYYQYNDGKQTGFVEQSYDSALAQAI